MNDTTHCSYLPSLFGIRQPEFSTPHPASGQPPLVPIIPCLYLAESSYFNYRCGLWHSCKSKEPCLFMCWIYLFTYFLPVKKFHLSFWLLLFFNFLKEWWLLFKLLEKFPYLNEEIFVQIKFFKTNLSPDNVLYSLVNPKDKFSFSAWGKKKDREDLI